MSGDFGYNGKILRIDLTQRRYKEEPLSDELYRLYAGGGLLGTYFLLRETKPHIDPFGADNLLVFTSSVIAGLKGVGLARFSVVSKSPLSGGIGETRCEGPWGSALKASGFDALLVSGRSEHPLYIIIKGGRVEFHDAASLWGRDTAVSTRLIRHQHGELAHVAAIGVAGENLVRFASIVTDNYYQAMRMGMGAVMGSKNLKAIVLVEGSLPDLADPRAFARIDALNRSRISQNDLTRWQKEPPGFSAWIDTITDPGYLSFENFRNGETPDIGPYAKSRFMEFYAGEGDCPGCPNECIKQFDTGTTKGSGGIHQEVSGSLGPNVGLTDLNVLVQANIFCNLQGLDPVSAGFSISFAMECFEKGLLTKIDTGGIDLKFGANEAILPMLQMVVDRIGLGNVLAEGSRRAAEQLGPDTSPFAMHVKSVEMTCFEPRGQTNLGLGFAVAPIGPRYDICEHDWDFDTRSGWTHTLESSRTLGILRRIPMDYLGRDKVRNFKALNNLWSACDALDFCIFASPPTRALTMTDLTEIVRAITGWETSAYELMRWGERRNHLMRVYNLREGFSSADDTLPDRFFTEPIRTRHNSQTRLDRNEFQKVLHTYYEMMGWDERGIPREATLIDYELEWTMESVVSDWEKHPLI
jgi:aldehyde:ferredoxin oxidoreductase